MSRYRCLLIAGSVGVLSLLIAGCGGSEPTPAASPPAFHRAGATELDAKRMSLTGLPGEPNRAPIVVKVNNIAPGGSQLGIDQADIVAEELVEGGLTRIAPMYQSRVPPVVGPVRSLRSTDVGLVLPTHGRLVDSGGSSWERR